MYSKYMLITHSACVSTSTESSQILCNTEAVPMIHSVYSQVRSHVRPSVRCYYILGFISITKPFIANIIKYKMFALTVTPSFSVTILTSRPFQLKNKPFNRKFDKLYILTYNRFERKSALKALRNPNPIQDVKHIKIISFLLLLFEFCLGGKVHFYPLPLNTPYPREHVKNICRDTSYMNNFDIWAKSSVK